MSEAKICRAEKKLIVWVWSWDTKKVFVHDGPEEDMTENQIPVGYITVPVTWMEPSQAAINKARIQHLRMEEVRLREIFYKRVKEIQEKIESLMAITSESKEVEDDCSEEA